MAKRGRRNKRGVRPGWMLLRSVMVLHAYDQARARGEKHSAAITETVSAVRSRVPGMPISETEVKRTLAEFRSKDCKRSWIISASIVHGQELDTRFENLKWIADISRGKFAVSIPGADFNPTRFRALAIQVGPRPRSPRHNAKC